MSPTQPRNRSTRAISKGKQTRSASNTASIHVPREIFGSTRLPIRPTPRCPTNIAIVQNWAREVYLSRHAGRPHHYQIGKDPPSRGSISNELRNPFGNGPTDQPN